jgi:uncharacterized protein YkwD
MVIIYTVDTVKTKQTNKQTISLKKRLRRHVKLAIVPHKANQYRPHLVRRYGLIAVLAVVVGVQMIYNTTTTGTVLGDKADISLAALVKGTNDVRRGHQVDELRVSQKLNQAAQLKAEDMFTRQYRSDDSRLDGIGATPVQHA